MDFYTIKSRFENDFLLKLLRSPNAPLFLSFAYQEFKATHALQLNYYSLKIKLVIHLEECDYQIPDRQDIEDYANNLLESWCKEDYQLLRRYYDSEGEILVELTSYSEHGLRLIEEIGPKEFIGTESRFSMIYTMLKELSSRSNLDPEKRIKELKLEKKRVEEEIKQIEESGKVISFTDFQIKERYYQISSLARDLLSDFKEVDNNFRSMVKKFYIKGMKQDSKGEFLGATLDGYTELMESPQGKSFTGFWQFLLADIGHDKISDMVSEIYDSAEALGLDTDDRLLFNLKSHLYRYGEKILNSNHKLAEKLNRIISDPKRRDSKRLNSLIHQIKSDILNMGEIKDDQFLTIQGSPSLYLINERPLRFPENEIKYQIPNEFNYSDSYDLSELFSLQTFEREKINRAIRNLLKSKDRVSLSEIIKNDPVEFGAEEIITYFDIASSSSKNRIIVDEIIKIYYKSGDKQKVIEVPEVIFCK